MSGAIQLDNQPPKPGLGDWVERQLHPIAVALKLPCLDEKQEHLRPESPCAKRRDELNKIGEKVEDIARKIGL